MHRLCRPLPLAVALLSGCFCSGKRDDLPPPPPDQPINAAAVYSLGCPDLIEVTFVDWPDVSHAARIGADGCIPVGTLGRIRVEGGTAAEAAAAIAQRAQIPARKVRVRVVEYNSRHVLVYSAANGEPRLVDYRGPETVIELLERISGLGMDGAAGEIHVVRAQLGEGIPAEVLPVDLEAILEKHDTRANIRVQPLDSIYIGELPRSWIGRSLPAILRPAYDLAVDLLWLPQPAPGPEVGPEQ
jgi:protein involved in polysaccharide export with SLBB domain